MKVGARRTSHIPVSSRTDIPPQKRITGSTLSRNPSRLHFSEMRFKEVDLMLPIYARRVDRRLHHAEMIPHLPGIDRSSRLRDQLGSSHCLAIPVRGAIERDLDSLVASRVRGILV